MSENFNKIAVSAVKKAGGVLLQEYAVFDREKIMLKSKHEIVTKADLLAEELIIKEINVNFPTHGIISEEAGIREPKAGARTVWIIDPIDGTTNFSIHNPLWCISIAVGSISERPEKMRVVRNKLSGSGEKSICLEDIEIIFGAIFMPVTGELFTAEKGSGTLLNGRPTEVSSVKKGKVLHTFCHGSGEANIKKALDYYRKQKLSGFDCRQMGSAAIELAYVSVGRIESIMIPGANIWDVAAGALLVSEAGGRVTDFSGRTWYPGSKDILATNGYGHKEILKLIT